MSSNFPSGYYTKWNFSLMDDPPATCSRASMEEKYCWDSRATEEVEPNRHYIVVSIGVIRFTSVGRHPESWTKNGGPWASFPVPTVAFKFISIEKPLKWSQAQWKKWQTAKEQPPSISNPHSETVVCRTQIIIIVLRRRLHTGCSKVLQERVQYYY